MRIYLIGMPGVGKSTIGEILSKKINYNYIDLDNYIEEKSMMFIDEIFSSYGEKYFRDLETNCLKEVSKLNNIVISCGGGIVENSDNKKIMNGYIIYLDSTLENIKKRIENQNIIRPLLEDNKLEYLYKRRIDKYNYFANDIIKNDNIDLTVDLIIKKLDMDKKILILNGPNLNMLGKRPKEHYGTKTLDEINDLLIKENDSFFKLDFYQSNNEGDIITKIQNCLDYYAIIINPAAYTHTSIGIRDALEMFLGIKIEIHLSMVDSREEFRKNNYIRDVCDTCFQGELENSYLKALKYVKDSVK